MTLFLLYCEETVFTSQGLRTQAVGNVSCGVGLYNLTFEKPRRDFSRRLYDILYVGLYTKYAYMIRGWTRRYSVLSGHIGKMIAHTRLALAILRAKERERQYFHSNITAAKWRHF